MSKSFIMFPEKVYFEDDEHIQWLRDNDEPLEEVVNHWKASHFSRENAETENKKNRLQYYLQFPIMKKNLSYKLVCKSWISLFMSNVMLYTIFARI